MQPNSMQLSGIKRYLRNIPRPAEMLNNLFDDELDDVNAINDESDEEVDDVEAIMKKVMKLKMILSVQIQAGKMMAMKRIVMMKAKICICTGFLLRSLRMIMHKFYNLFYCILS
ncbi:hypothetical protein U1Q18_042358 [Sarracenia purpurea var. burkii]